MKKHILYLFVLFSIITSCKQDYKLSKIEGVRLEINDSISSQLEIDSFVLPFKKHVDSSLSKVLAYSPETYSKSDGELNTAIGNLFADAVFIQTKDLFYKRSSEQLDFVLLNYGGIRSILSKGPVTIRECFELMPFENEIVVVGLKGSEVNNLIAYLVQRRQAHPISKSLKITLDEDYNLLKATINGNNIDNDKVYFIGTNDYLLNGGSNMTFLQKNESTYLMDYKIRNALIDYFTAKDTVNPVRDQRFIREIN